VLAERGRLGERDLAAARTARAAAASAALPFAALAATPSAAELEPAPPAPDGPAPPAGGPGFEADPLPALVAAAAAALGLLRAQSDPDAHAVAERLERALATWGHLAPRHPAAGGASGVAPAA
jgi:hypothetical protein